MKYALCFRGIHYWEAPQLHQYVDFEKSYNNIKHFLLDEIKDYDIFISSYYSIKHPKLLETYKPVNFMLSNFDSNDNTFKAQLIHHLNCAQMIINYEREHNIKYDMIVITRFDYIYFRLFSEMNIDLTKFNITMKHSSGNCDDNLWVFPRSMLIKFIEKVICLLNTGGITHAINHEFEENEINYMYQINQDDYDNLTTYQYNYKNNFELDKVIEHLNKHKNMNLNREKLLV